MSVDLVANLKKAESRLQFVLSAEHSHYPDGHFNENYNAFADEDSWLEAYNSAKVEVYAANECLSAMESGLR